MLNKQECKKLFNDESFFSYDEYLSSKTEYQEIGERLLMENKRAFLFYEPGKGKTYPAVFACREVAPTGRVLILSTADAINNMWNFEIVPQEILPANTVTMSFTTAIQEKVKQKLLKIRWDVIIVDESHKIKSHNSQISKLVYLLTKPAHVWAWGLTGTPRGNNDLDIFCQFHNMNVSDWGAVSYNRFIDTCCDVERKYGPSGPYQNVLGVNDRYRAGWERNVAMYSQRETYEDGEMPALSINPIILPYEITKEYKLAEDGCMAIDDYATTMAKLAAITKMHQAANGYLYYTPDLETMKRVTHRFQHNKKLDWLKANLTNEPTTIVYRHAADLEDLETCLLGKTTENINDFKAGKFPILLLQCSRCESFNLQMCRRLIFYTLDYSYIKFKQMLHRVWRKGQERDTEIVILLFEGTIEETIWSTVSNKKKLADLFMSAKRSV